MATIKYTNAVLLVNGAELTGALHEFGVEYSAEILDRTVMGNDTRVKAGGLYTGKVSGKGYFDGAVNTDQILFNEQGGGDNLTLVSGALLNPAYQAGLQPLGTVLLAFPDGVTPGSTTTGMGYACRGVLSTFNIGGVVGTELDITFAAESFGYLS